MLFLFHKYLFLFKKIYNNSFYERLACHTLTRLGNLQSDNRAGRQRHFASYPDRIRWAHRRDT